MQGLEVNACPLDIKYHGYHYQEELKSHKLLWYNTCTYVTGSAKIRIFYCEYVHTSYHPQNWSY